MFTIGCDPELICHRHGRFVPASDYFKANSSFGLDGCEVTAEIRPGFSESPVDLTAKIFQILEYGHDKATELEFYACTALNITNTELKKLSVLSSRL